MKKIPKWAWNLPEPILNDPLSPLQLPLELRLVLARRGYKNIELAKEILNPKVPTDPLNDFPDLTKALERLTHAIHNSEKIAICGDYDADGMTSTALLLRVFKFLGAKPIPAIPNRIDEGYGLNKMMVKSLHDKGVKLLITVDNGVAANEAIDLANDLGIEVIITDHHTIPNPEPNALALIHPATTPINSPYRQLAGVGLAYIIAVSMGKRLNKLGGLTSARDLFCIGTIGDMAPVLGANRYWLKEGLKNIHKSECKGLKALLQISGTPEKNIRSEDIGFKIAPRINAVGRIGDPKLIIELLTSEDETEAMNIARQCDTYNRQRRDLCDAIETEALALIESDRDKLSPFILIAQSHWHSGVIGIVATRLMQRFNRPAALLTSEGNSIFRASVRSPKGFSTDKTLKLCHEYLEKYGGHPAAGGFTVKAENVSKLHNKLNELASIWIKDHGQLASIYPEVLVRLEIINRDFWNSLLEFEPFGIGYEEPLFWASDCRVEEIKIIKGNHLKLIITQGNTKIGGIFWNWKGSADIPRRIDIAFKLYCNNWLGKESIELDIKAIRKYDDQLALIVNGNKYLCEKINNRNFYIKNEYGDIITASIKDNNDVVCNDERINNVKVMHLLKQASICLGFVP